VILGLGLLLAACGKEAGRVPFTAEGPKEATLALKAGDVAFWTDIDLEFEGNSDLFYQVDLVQNGATVATAECDPLGHLSVKTSWVSTDIGNKHSRSGNGKMPCDVKLAAGGPTTVKATLTWSHKPTTLTLKKADLVVKQ
jgi:hypothetical protein